MIISHPVRLPVIGVNEHKTPGRRQNIPHLQISGGGHHFTIEIIGIVTVSVFIKILSRTPAKQLCLVVLSVGPIVADRILGGDSSSEQRDILGNKFSDPQLHLLRGIILCPGNGNIQTGTDRAVHLPHRTGPQLPQGQENNELSRPAIGILAGVITVTKQLDLAAGSRHGPADGGAVGRGILLPDRYII